MKSEVNATLQRLNIDKDIFVLKSSDYEYLDNYNNIIPDRFLSPDFYIDIEKFDKDHVQNYLKNF